MAEKKLKVLHVIQTQVFGGGELQTLAVTKALAIDGHSVCVVCHAKNHVFLSKLKAEKIKVHTVGAFNLPSLFNTVLLAIELAVLLIRLHCKFKPDVTCACTLLSALVLSCIKWIASSAFIYSIMVVHNTSRLSLAFKIIARKADGIIYNSKYTKDQYRQFFGDKIPCIINYSIVFPPPKLNQERRSKVLEIRRKYLRRKKVLVGFVGRISPEKRVEDFIDAASHFISKNSNARFVLIGGSDMRYPEYYDTVMQQAKKSPACQDIVFCNHVDDTTFYLAAMDVVVIPTWGEGFGRVALEASFLNVPVIATTPSGTDEILDLNRNSAKVPWESPDLIARELNRLVTDVPFDLTKRSIPNTKLSSTFDTKKLIENEIKFYKTLVSV